MRKPRTTAGGPSVATSDLYGKNLGKKPLKVIKGIFGQGSA